MKTINNFYRWFFIKMKITVVGAGAMGCLYAAMLSRAGREVWLLEKTPARVEAVKRKGILIEETHGRLSVPFTKITSDPARITASEVVIIFVKAYDSADAIKAVAPAISEKTTVVTLQNGLGNVDKIVEFVPQEQVLAGITAHGATLLGDGHVRHSGVGETVIGALKGSGNRREKVVKELLNDAGISTRISRDINGVLWGKLLVNIGINPLTAVMRIKNGQILKCRPLVRIMHRAVNEGIAVAKQHDIVIPFSDPLAKVEQVCKATSENRSSMLQDIEAGRKTEIDFINGAVAAMGCKVNVATPANSFLTDMIHSIEDILSVDFDA